MKGLTEGSCMKKIFGIMLTLSLIIGCATGPTVNERYQAQLAVTEAKVIGQPAAPLINRMIASLGPPASILNDGSRGKIYTWERSSTRVIPGDSTTYNDPGTFQPNYSYSSTGGYMYHGGTYTPGGSRTYTNPPTVRSSTTIASIWVDAEGKITRITGNVR
jgi:hypothetical protein